MKLLSEHVDQAMRGDMRTQDLQPVLSKRITSIEKHQSIEAVVQNMVVVLKISIHIALVPISIDPAEQTISLQRRPSKTIPILFESQHLLNRPREIIL